MTISRLTAQDATGSSTAASVSATYASAPTTGNTLIADIYANVAPGVVALPGWTLVGEAIVNATTNVVSQWRKVAGASEPSTVTATATAATVMRIQVYEYAGVDTASPVDGSGSSSSGASAVTSLAAGSVTTTTAGDMLHAAWGFIASTSAWSVDSSFTVLQASIRLTAADRLAGVAGAFNPTLSWTTASRAGAVMVALKAAATSGSAPAGLPFTQVLLDDGSGTFPYDISGYVRRSTPGWATSRGWADENEQDGITPGQVTLRLDNPDGRFTLGSTTYPGSSGTLQKDQRVRVYEIVGGTAYPRFTGYVIDWPTQWESALGNMAYASVTAVDRMARLNRREMQSALIQEFLADAPAAFWPLSDPQGSSSAADMSGNGNAPLGVVGVGVAPVVFGVPAVGSPQVTGVGFGGGPAGNNGDYLETNRAPLGATSGTTIETFFRVAPGGAHSVPFVFTSGQQLGMGGSWQLFAFAPGPSGGTQVLSSGTVNDGVWHHAAFTADSSTLNLYLDGVLIGSSTASLSPALLSLVRVGLAPSDGVMTLAFVAEYASALPAARIKAHADAGLTYFVGDRTDQRLARLALYANVPPAEQNFETGVQLGLPAGDLSGKQALDAMREVSAAEGGALFADPLGRLTLHNKEHRVHSAMGTPVLTLGAGQYEPDAMFGAPEDYLINTATGSRAGGSEQRAVNPASVAKYEEYPVERSNALLPADQLLLDQLTWLVNVYGEPLPRLSTLTLDLLTLPVAVVQAAMSLEIGDLVRISGWPSQAPGGSGLVLDLIVEGLKENQVVTEQSATWQLTLNTAPAALFRAPIVDAASATVDTGLPVYF